MSKAKDNKSEKGNESEHDEEEKKLAKLDKDELDKIADEDEEDLKELKTKLEKIKSIKPPTDKEAMIEYLMERLDYSEQAIVEAENCITNERAKRLQLKEELQQKNDDLRKIVEGEKKTLQDKVHIELEKTLNAAIKAKNKAEAELKHKERECMERDMMCQELDLQTMLMRKEVKSTRDKDSKMEAEAKEMNSELDFLRKETKELKEENHKLNADIEEAYEVIRKLDEAKYTLNRLLGPNGVLSERERKKFLKQRGEEEYDMDGINDKGATIGANAGGGMTNANRNMLGSNNDYFFGDQQHKGEGMENNDDDFWYGAPKGGAYDQPGAIAGGEYKSYIGNTKPVDASLVAKQTKPPSAPKKPKLKN
eukprot:CAMPEP_0168328168 /NCGR_PEP_ID=MMETSP0213-20121227/6328_1 /TAXON_ID=151035 /ORGANISM="Euplotes harpa, Strain FSP1.4" /LENGTH=365 /DNA_ID=CAMNT_0008331203 /DNA_START=1 /DNA_END=1098 /DNA_ORIENTATION=+